jgi:hypothetical protein
LHARNALQGEISMFAGKQRTAKPRVSQCRTVSVEADALSRRLQEELGCSANQLAELAIFALAEAQKRRREHQTGA